MKAIGLPTIRLKYAVIFLFIAILVSSVHAVESSEQVIYEGGFAAGDLTWNTAEDGGQIPVLPDTKTEIQPNRPILPRKDLILLVPVDMPISSLRLEVLASHVEKTSRPVGISGPVFTDDDKPVNEAMLKMGENSYPEVWAEYTGSHLWRGYRLVTMTVYPVRELVSDNGNSIEFLDNYAIRAVNGKTAQIVEPLNRIRLVEGEAQKNSSVLAGLVANPEAINGYSRENGLKTEEPDGGFQPTKTPSISGSAVSYLIITNEALKPEFQRLADYKTSLGLPSVVVTTEYLQASFRNGADLQETIRMFLIDAYQKWGTEFVLLGGDSDILPPRYIYNTFFPTIGSTQIPVDLYFACLDGNWNFNGNSLYGEAALNDDPGDEADFADELSIGRAPVSSPQDVQVFVDKVLAYESTPVGENWPNRMLFAAEVLFPEDWSMGDSIILDGAEFADRMVNDTIEPCTEMEYVRMYQTDDLFPQDLHLTKNAFNDSLNTGNFGIVNQIGHGYFFNMSMGDANFFNSDADDLTNGDHLFMLYSLNCASAAFDYSCLMERFMQNPNGGSIVSLGSSRSAFPVTSDGYQQEFFSQLMCSPETHVGDLVGLSRLPFIGRTNANFLDRWTYENYTLLGDPTLSLWCDQPRPVAVGGTGGLVLGHQNLALTVTTGGDPVEGAMVCLQKADEDIVWGATDAAGNINLSFLPTSIGDAVLTVSGRNLALTQIDLPVAAGSAYLALKSTFVFDSGYPGSTGNGNNIVEAGETIAFFTEFEETGGAHISGGTATISTAAPGVTITAGAVDFAACVPFGSVYTAAPLIIEFAPDMADGTPVVFEVETVDINSNISHSRFTQIVKAPEIEIVNLDWSDEAYGDGENDIDAGERLTLHMEIKNYGSGVMDGLSAVLRSDDTNIALHDTLANVSLIRLMEIGSGDVEFSLEVINTSGDGGSRIVLTDNYGRVTVKEFTLILPEAPSDIVTDTSLGGDIIALSWTQSTTENVAGYDVYRSLAENTGYSKVNQDLIQGVAYFCDTDLDLLTQYFYKVVAVSNSMFSSEFSEIVNQATAPSEFPGFPLPFNTETSGHPAIGDLDNDGVVEIILASDEVYVWHANGQEWMDGDNNSQTLGPFTDLNSILHPAGVALGNLDDDSGLEIVVSEHDEVSQIHVFDEDGLDIPGWPQAIVAVYGGSTWNWATPAIGDVDGDGQAEVVVCTLDGVIWIWHADGTELRDGDNNPATNGVFLVREGARYEWSMSSPALCDLDDDGAKDIIFGTKNDATGQRRILALKYDGSNVDGFPYITSGPISCSPAIGDLNNDGVLEIVAIDKYGRVYVVQQDGSNYPGFPKNTGITGDGGAGASPALGDMDGDGQLEIIHAINVSGSRCDLFIIDTDSEGGTSGDFLPGWPIRLPGSSEGSPVIGDINGDSSPDIVFGIGGGDTESPDNLYAYQANGSEVSGFPVTLDGPCRTAPIICDLDRDNDVDIIYGSWGRQIHVWDMPFAYNEEAVYWPTFKGNIMRDGVILPRELVAVPEESEVPLAGFTVEAPYPNPFNPSTNVRLYVAPVNGQNADLDLKVYDLQGRVVRELYTGAISAGWHNMVWDGRDDAGRGQSSGLYFLRARSSGKVSTHKMSLVK